MVFCVNTHSREFKATAKRLNISEAFLEKIVHEYINTEGNAEAFPSDSYIQSKVSGEPLTEISEKAQKLIDLKYSKPITVDNYADAQAVMTDMAQYFDPKHIGLKETYDGKYEVTLATQKSQETPLKPQYRGKLIFAQSGTGKTIIADNVNVIDADTLLADELGTTPQSASFAMNNLSTSQKVAIGKRYQERIRQAVAEGKTVLTANSNMLEEADVVVYNETPELADSRTSSQDRVGSNRYSNIELRRTEQERIEKLREGSTKEFIALNENQHLADALLTDTAFKAIQNTDRADTLTEAASYFLESFGMNVNMLSSYRGSMPLFSAIDRTINAKSAKDITDGMGYAVAFMLQQEPVFQRLVIQEIFENMFPGSSKYLTEDFIDKVVGDKLVEKTNKDGTTSLVKKTGGIKIPRGLQKVVGRGYISYAEIYAHWPTKDAALKSIGKDIAKTLREYYNGAEEKSLLGRIWDAIKQFFIKVTGTPFYQERLNLINQLADSIVRKDESFVKGALYKPDSPIKAKLLDLEAAFKENPFEADIIKRLSNVGIALGGSTSIRTEGTIYRPANNPLHDIDFSAAHIGSKAELTKVLNNTFDNIEHVRTIGDRKTKALSTETYLMMDRPFRIEEAFKVKGKKGEFNHIYDKETGERLGTMNLQQQELELEKGVQGKLLDFFIDANKSGEKYGRGMVTINGEEYLISSGKNAFDAKVTWQRRKDLFDYRNYVPDNFTPTDLSGISMNREVDGMLDLLDTMSKVKIGNYSRNGELLSYFKGQYYVPKGTSIQEIENFRERNLLPKGLFEVIKNPNSTVVRVNQEVLQDAIARNEKNANFANLFENGVEAEQVQTVLDFLSTKTGLKYLTVSEEEAKQLLGKKDIEGVNAFVNGDTAYFIEGRKLNTDIAAEEMLHPFVASIKVSNPEAFKSLYADARRSFPRLRLEIAKAYERENWAEELVTQSLSRAFRQDFEAKPNHNAISDLITKFINHIKGWFRNAGDIPLFSKRDRIYAQDLDGSITIQNLAQIINTEINLGNANNIQESRLNAEEVTDEGLSIPETEPVRDELLKFQESADKVNTELNNVLNSDLISNEEVRKVGEKVVYFISDSITELIEDPNKVFSIFQSLATRDGKPMTEEQKSEEIEKIKQMSRVELARYVGIQRLIDFAVNRLFTVGGNARFAQLATRRSVKKANLIKENINTILKFAKNAFLSVENFTIAVDNGEISITEDVTPDSEEFNNENDVDSILENEGNLQEHWQIISRTQEAMASMSQLVKSVLNRCFQLKVNEETGAIENVEDDFGIAERMDVKDATASILKWTIGAESLSHMVKMLEEKAATNPWVQQVVDKLKDTSGKEADFQSQFYGVFAKSFQPYSIVLRERNEKTGQYEYKSIAVNQHPALTDATKAVEVAFKTNNHPLFLDGKVRRDALDTLTSISQDLVEMAKTALENNDRAKLVDLIAKASVTLGYPIEYSDVNLALDNNKSFKDIVEALSNIVNNLKRGADRENYDPFTYGKENSISGYLKNFLTPLTAKLEETAVSSFYDSGKMYQSYVAPSYLTVLMNKFQSSDERFAEFLENEYGKYEWFRNADGTWKNLWLERLANLNEEQRKDLFKHKVQLNFNKHNYMKNMSDVEYGLSILTEFFSAFDSSKGSIFKAWFRVPIMSNKPSSEFLMMEAYTGKFMETMLLDGFSRIFQQELGRIQTVEIRDYNKKNPNFIKNFDKNGRKFVMLDFFNQYLRGGKQANSELGTLINKAIQEGTEFDAKTKKGLTSEENARMLELVSNEIKTNMDAKAERIIAEWKQNGIFEGAKQIKNIGTDDAVVEKKLREFIWNDAFASMNILELTITDPAFYKDSEDLQKRLAQIHAPGTRANVEATDYEGNKVTDGKFRTILLKDFDDFVSNIKDNLRVVFDKKLKELRDSGVDTESSKYKAAATTYQSIIDQFDNINVADAQGYSSPTSYRKKAFIFGKWSRASEDIYQKLKRGIYTYSDLQTAFQPLKPFVYGQIEKPSIDNDRAAIARPMSKLKVPVQFKNSEYLLIMADAILQGENTGKPNLLRAIYEVMEESAEKNPGRGIDTIQFESTCKSGLMAPIDIKQYYNAEGGEILAKQALENAIYNPDGSYNSGTYVYEVPFENYAIQQEVPEHFKNHYQAHGSQIRYIIPSDLESVDSDGNAVTYNYFDRGEEKKLSAEEFKREYEQNISENIEASLNELSEQLGLGEYYLSQKDRNIALSKVLLDEIYRSPRYGVELAAACTVNSETGKFNIPLGDPIQSKRIEQLINSIVKNRVNKQEVAGGPVVQVTNFGTSKELNIRFNSKEGGLLMTKAEWEAEKAKLPAEVYHYSDDVLTEFTHKEDNYFSKFKGGSKNAIFFTDNAAPKEGTVLARNHKYAVKLSADRVKVVYGTKDDLHKRGSSYTEEVNAAEQEGYDAVRFVGLDDNQERGQNITVIFDPSKATILRDEGRVTSQESQEDTYEEYVKKNQAGIAYFEVFAPIFANELFEKFADKDGNIDIETIEKINPDLLKMIGYRIPTEDKYSMAPLKIVGFLPREAGDGIMLPNDITLLTGSDFDVDKFYLMRKEIGITRRFLGDMSSYTVGQDSEVQVNKASIRKELLNKLEALYQRNMTLPKAIKGRVEERADIIIEGRIEEAQKAKENRYNNSQYHIDALNRQKDERLKRAQEDYDRNADVIEKAFKEDQISEEEYNERMNKLDDSFDKKNKSIEEKFQAKLDKAKVPSKDLTEEEISKIRDERNSLIYDLAKSEQKELIRRAIDDFLEDPNRKATNALMQDIKNAYIEYMYDYVEDTEGTTYRNNKIVDMSWAVLTNETTASKMLTPGGFDPEKSMGYLVSAYQNPANNFTWEELLSLENREKGLLDGKIVDLDPDNSDIETGIDALKSLCYTEKNLSFIDTHLQFYKQNSAAATALGMAAVQKIGHAVLESDGFTLNVSEILSLEPDEFISIAGKEFSGLLEIDAKYNDEGDLIGRTLGEFVAMFADAVKDPVANLMNINNTTMPIITAMIRLGMPFRDAALFVSQPAIRRVLNLYNSENVTNFATLTGIAEKQIKTIQERYGTEEDSYIEELNTLSKEELINALNPRWREKNSEEVDVIDYKVLKFFLAMDKISKALKPATFATRFNSISNAVGPLVVDNLIMEYKASQELKGIYDRDKNEVSFDSILARHPILNSFYKTLNMSREILDEMPTNSGNFRAILSSADADLQRILYGDRKLLSTLSDFYQSYLLIASGAIPAEATAENKHQGLKYYIEQFPSDFMRGNAKELFKGNKLIDAIKLDIQRGRAVLRVDTTGLSPLDKERLSDGWVDLYKSGERGKKLAEHLFYYNFFRTGIGFSPKSFMNLFPTRLKSYILGYNETFDVHNFKFAENVVKELVLDQFIRNNADNNKLAPRVKFGKDGLKPEMKDGMYIFRGNDYSEVSAKPYIKVKVNGTDVLLKRMTNDKDSKVASFVALRLLGNNGEYFEASLNGNYTPLAVPSTVKEQRSEGELEEVTVAETESSDIIPSSEVTPAEENKRLSFIRDALIKAFELTGRTTEQAKAKIQEFKNKPEADKAALTGQMKKWLRNKFEALGIEADEKLVDEAYEELC